MIFIGEFWFFCSPPTPPPAKPTSASTGVASPYPRPSPALAEPGCRTRGVFLRGGTRREQLHTPRTNRQPPAPERPHSQGRSGGRGGEQKRSGSDLPDPWERGVLPENRKKTNKKRGETKRNVVCGAVFRSPARPRAAGEAEGRGAGWKIGVEIHPRRLSANGTPGGTQNFFTSPLEISLF